MGLVGAWITGGGWLGLGTAPLNAGWTITGVGDFNNDGKADVLWENQTTGLVGAWITGGGWLGLGSIQIATAPIVTGITPTAGSLAGGTAVTITGTGFTAATAVDFGGTAATNFVINSATQITATSPAGTGTVDVTVTTAGGTSADSSADKFGYMAAPVVTVTDAGGTYTGNPFAATAASVTGTGGNTIASFGSPSLSYAYFHGTTPLGSVAPTSVGSYTVVATFAGNSDYASASSGSVPFNITKATPVVVATDAGGIYSTSTYPASATVAGVGTQSTAALTLETVGTTFTYYAGDTATGTPLSGAPTTVGTYTVLASFAGSADYAAASNSKTFNITKATASVTVTPYSVTYDGTAHTATVWQRAWVAWTSTAAWT